MSEKQNIEIPISELKEGDTLAQDIGFYDNFKANTIITKNLLEQIKRLDIKKVIIQPEIDFSESEKSDNSEVVEKILKDNEKHAQTISKRIENSLAGKLLTTTDNIKEISESINIDLNSMDNNDKEEAVKILNFVGQADLEIKNLESKPKIEKTNLLDRLDKKVEKIDTVYTGLLNKRQEAVQVLEKEISEFINQTGPNRDASVLLKDVINQRGRFLANHCMNVTIISLVTAIELTKLMEEKIRDVELTKNIGMLRAIRFKTFNRHELIKLGFAAFVHDIYYKKVFPNLSPSTTFESITDKSKIEKHSSESYHLMKQFEMDYHVNKAVLQHHERIDGSGTPDGISSRIFSKYTAIISFADRYVTLTQPNPFNPVIHPTSAIKRLLTTEKKGFDSDVMIAFAKAATMVPIGSWVQLENNSIGYASSKIEGTSLPAIRIVMKNSGEPLDKPQNVNPGLSENRIIKLLDNNHLKDINPNFINFYTD